MTTADRLRELIEKATPPSPPEAYRPFLTHAFRLERALASVAPLIAGVLEAGQEQATTAAIVHLDCNCLVCAIGALESALAKELDRG